MTKLVDMTVSEWLAELRSSAPTPGGGSAAALAGSMGAALLAMVAALPKPRAATGEDLDSLARAGERCTTLARRLEAVVDEDSDAYQHVMNAYRLPKSSDAEKSARMMRIQEALRAAVDAPLEVMRACTAAIADVDLVRSLGNPNAASDVGVAAALLAAARRGARLNVDINLDTMKDQAYITAVRDEVQRLDPASGLSGSGAAGDPNGPR